MKGMMTSIAIRTQFKGLHKYENAPVEVAYLRDLHRHVFYVEVEMRVETTERDLEFILVRNALDDYLEHKAQFEETFSCERMANEICLFLIKQYGERSMKCCVYEDNENGGCVYYEF